MMLVMTSVAQLLALLVLKLVKNMIFRSRGFWPRRAILGMNRVRGGLKQAPGQLVCLGRGVSVEACLKLAGCSGR